MSMSESANGESAFVKRYQHILGAKILNLIEKYPDGPPLSVLSELQKEKLGTGDVTNFHNVQPTTKKGLTRSKRPFSKPSTANSKQATGTATKTSPVSIPKVPKSSSLTSNYRIYSKSRPASRPTSAQKSISVSNKDPRKSYSGKSSIMATSQKSKPAISSIEPDQRRPNAATGDFAEPKETSGPVTKPNKPLAQRFRKPPVTAPQKNNKGPIVSMTQVVLAPRFGPESSEPSVLNVVQQRCRTAPAGRIWGRNSNSSVTSTFSAEKTKWVQRAVYKIGESLWSASGLIPPKAIDSPEIQGNFGELYDLAVKSKSQGLSSSAHEETKRKLPSVAKTLSDDHSDRSIPSLGSHLSFSLFASTKEPPNHVTNKQMCDSDLLLDTFRDKLVKESKISRMKDASTDTQPDSTSLANPENESKGDDKEESDDTDDDTPKLIHNCYISEGKIIPEDGPHKFTLSTFALLSTSLRRVKPSLNNTYFRRTVDLRGFEVHELRFKYSSTRIFVEGKQPQKGDKNARLVREIISLPPELTIKNLKVMRGKKGVVVFEEIIKPKQHNVTISQ